MDLDDIRANRRNTLYELKYRIIDRLEASSDRDFASLSLRLMQVVAEIAEIETAEIESRQPVRLEPVVVESEPVDIEHGKKLREIMESKAAQNG